MSFKSRILLVLVSLALIVSFFANRLNLAAAPALAASNDCDSDRSIQVSGSATVKVIPDLVTVQLGVTSNATTPQAVYDQNTAAMKKVIAAIRLLGVAEKDISTDYYLIQPVYSDYNSLDIRGYRISNHLVVNLKDVSKVSQVLAVALSAGANEVVDVQFKTSQLRQYRDQARQLAMQAAQEKARDLAGAANAQPGCVLNI
ncbi:MAG TPA: SIMPL domain-containing protein, partial [Anaerolineae bacterium]|nr:SIMPL domain-containing protein [Anaerolineae bacterium]